MKERLLSAFENYFGNVIERIPEFSVGFALLLFFIFIGILSRKLVQNRLSNRIKDKLLLNFIGRSVLLLFIIVGIVFFLNQIGLGTAASGLLAGAGVTALILGFAFKDLGENFLAGFFLAFSRPFNIGNIIEINNHMGQVQAMTFRNTHIRTFDGRDIFIPNALIIKNPLINYTRDGLMRHEFVIGLDYGVDLSAATELILTTLNAQKDISSSKELTPFVIIEKFASSTINLKIYFWINTNDFLGSITVLKSSVMKAVVEALIAEGFSMPADILELKIYQENNPIPINIKNLDSLGDDNGKSK
ncbi:Small-conductance mechanosensitive channel [Marivirga sericea]|uniref:Small-conductance mechanosensitive channel n=1 Tax=Marivirga sericea TaxID=1028 RepID=A0A1X7LEB1_9BACT|nr:mechanosensitive ion channel domain-containing protein [Marivirga sericea]SMG51592.1 Small-conductance mechanosensitive channel [Marivirga sericea]